MENITAYFVEYTVNRSDINNIATERWTKETTNITATGRWTEEKTNPTVSSDAGSKMESTTAYFVEYTMNRSDPTEQWTNENTNSTVLSDADMSQMAMQVVWVVLACIFGFLLVVAVVSQAHRCRKNVKRRRTFRESASNSVIVKFTPQSKPGEHLVNPQKPSAFGACNLENDSRISGIKKSAEEDIYEKDSDAGSCQLEISTFAVLNKNYVSKEKLNVDDTKEVNTTA